MTTLTNVPASITAGDSVSWVRYVPDREPSSGWSLSYTFASPTSRIALTSSDNGDGGHLISVTAAASAVWVPCVYRWQAYVTDGTDRETVETGSLTVHPDFSAAPAHGYDDRSPARKWLDKLLAAREVLVEGAPKVVLATEGVGGRSRSYRSLEEIEIAIRRAKGDVASEERAERLSKGLGHRGNIHVRF